MQPVNNKLLKATQTPHSVGHQSRPEWQFSPIEAIILALDGRVADEVLMDLGRHS
jgi:hypothetical protein